MDVLAQVDLVVAFGASPYTTGQKTLFRNARLVHVDIDPTRIVAHSEVTLGVFADAESVSQQVLARLEPHGLGPASFRQPEILARLGHPKVAADDRSDANGLDPVAVPRAFDRVLPADRLLVLGAGPFSTVPGRYVDIRRAPSGIRHTAEAGSTGLGLGVAIGAAVARPKRATVLFAGDGGFSMSLADLETVARHQLPLTFVVMDGGAYGAELRQSERCRPARPTQPCCRASTSSRCAGAGHRGLRTAKYCRAGARRPTTATPQFPAAALSGAARSGCAAYHLGLADHLDSRVTRSRRGSAIERQCS